MLGAFAATPDQITWILTSYMVAAAVVMPLTGFLSNWLGRRRLLFLSITGFTASSALCGVAWNLESMVVFRLAQGVFGAPLVPLSQGIILDAFPKERHGQALAIFGLGIMVAPVAGPALGGYLTELYSWRTVFYINIPIGIFALVLAMGHLPKRAIKDIQTDWVGLGLLVLAVGSLQYVLDQGQTRDWFNSKVIVVGTIIAVFTSAAFFLRGWNKSDNIIDLSLLKDRNFVAGTLAITAYGISLYGWMAVMPLFTQRLRLSGRRRGNVVYSTSHCQRHHASDYRQHSRPPVRRSLAGGRRASVDGARHLPDGVFFPLRRFLGNRHAGHDFRHRLRPVFRTSDRRCLCHRSQREIRRGVTSSVPSCAASAARSASPW